MKTRYLLPLAIMAMPLMALAVPAYPGVMRVINPDGTTVEIIRHGDERFNFVTDAEETVLLEKDSKGHWRPMIRDGRELTFTDANVSLLKSKAPMWDVQVSQSARANAPLRMGEIDNQGRTNYPTIGDGITSLVVLMEFPDRKFTVPSAREEISAMLNEEGYSNYGAMGSVLDYFNESSNGLFRPDFEVSPIVMLDHDHEYYTGAGTSLAGAGNSAYFGYAIKEALTKLEAQGFDFSRYDLDNDGILDTVYFFYAGVGQADSGDTTAIWPHQGEYSRFMYTLGLPTLKVGGKTVGPYACSGELMGVPPRGESQPYLTGIGTFCHEYGHVLGLPDFYDVDYGGTKDPDTWSIMAGGSYNNKSHQPPRYSAYEQWCCHWLEFEEMVEGTSYELETISGDMTPRALRARVRRPSTTEKYYDEYYIFETRTPDSWDGSLMDHGLLIWHINFVRSSWNNNAVNVNRNPHVELMGSDESRKQWVWPGTSDPVTVLYPSHDSYFTPRNSSPVYKMFLTDIEFDAEEKVSRFGYNIVTEQPDFDIQLSEDAARLDNERKVKVSWKPVSGAEGYWLTCYRLDSNRNRKYIDQSDRRDVGNVSEWTISNFSSTPWESEVFVYIEAYDSYGIPSTKKSNVINFVPSELPAISSVDNVTEASLQIRVEGNNIIAPEGAEIYTTSGMLIGSESLPKGIYIVVFNGQSTKLAI